MGMAKKLSEDIADLLLNERVTITLDDDQTDEYVQQVLDDNRFLVMGNDYQERKDWKSQRHVLQTGADGIGRLQSQRVEL